MIKLQAKIYQLLRTTILLGILAVVGFGMQLTKVNAATGINTQLNYQGKLNTSTGIAVSNSSYNFRFRIYSAASGGSLLWTERWVSTTTQVSTVNGIFSVALGSISSIASVDFNSDSLYLQVDLDADSNGSWEEVFSTRKRLTATPYAFNAGTIDGFNATSTAAVANYLLALDSNGNLDLFSQGVSSTYATTTNLYVTTNITGTGFDTAWNRLFNATTTWNAFGTNWDSLFSATTTWAHFTTNFNTLLNATTTLDLDSLVVGNSTITTLNASSTTFGTATGYGLFNLADLRLANGLNASSTSNFFNTLTYGSATTTGTLNINGYASTTNLVLNPNGTNLGTFNDLYNSGGNLFFDTTQITGSNGLGFWNYRTNLGGAISPTSTTAGIYVTASSTIAANFRVDGNATTTGSFTVGSLTSGRVPYISTGGLLVDSAGLTFAPDTLTITGQTATANLALAPVAGSSANISLGITNDYSQVAYDTNTDIYYLRNRTTGGNMYIGVTDASLGLHYPIRIYSNSMVFNDAGLDYDMRFESVSNPNTIYVDAVTGNVGIGTSTQKYALTISTTTVAGSTGLLQVATTTSQNIFTINANGTATFGQVDNTATSTFAHNLQIASGRDLQVQRIYSYSPLQIRSDVYTFGNNTTTGFLNIGTTDIGNAIPGLFGAGDLFIGGDATTTGSLALGNNTTATSTIFFDGSNDLQLDWNGSWYADGGELRLFGDINSFRLDGTDPWFYADRTASTRRGGFALMTNGTASWYIGQPDSDLNGTAWDGTELFIGSAAGGNGTNGLWLESNGNVGFGTTSPNWLLQTGSLPGGTYFSIDTSGNATSSGKLVIGTTNPTGPNGAGDLFIGADATTTGSLSVGSLTTGSIIVGGGTTGPLSATSTLAVNIGGTGATTHTAGSLLLGNGTSPFTSTSTLSVVRGGTGAATYTANQLLYGAGTSPLTSSANLTFNGSTLALTGAQTISSTLSVTGDTGLGGITPATRLDVDSGSNSLGIRIRGLAETAEIADMYVGSFGQFVISTENTTDSLAYIEVDPADNQYGFIIRDGADNGSTQFANLYTVDATVDYLNISVNATNAVNALVVTDNDTVGAGTSTPEYTLTAARTDTPTFSQFTGSFFSNGTTRVNIQSNSATLAPGIEFNANGEKAHITLKPTTGDLQFFNFSGTDPDIRIDSNGKLLVGTSTALTSGGGAGWMEINGDKPAIQFNDTNSSDMFITVDDGSFQLAAGTKGAGTASLLQVTSGGAGAILDTWSVGDNTAVGTDPLCWDGSGDSLHGDCTSLGKYKTNVADLPLGLTEVMNLRPRVFNWRRDPITHTLTDDPNVFDPKFDLGFVAEEVAAVNPLLASYIGPQADEQLSGVKYERLTALLVNAIQQQQGQIEQLQNATGVESGTSITNNYANNNTYNNNTYDNNTYVTVINSPDVDIETLIVQQAATFYGTLYVRGEAGFEHKVTFEDDIEIKGKIYASADQAGSATISAGATSTEVVFNAAYNNVPTVVANLSDDDEELFVNWKIVKKTEKGFVILLQETQNQDVKFDWIALGQSGINGVVSSGNGGEKPKITELSTSVPSIGPGVPVELWAKVTDPDTAEKDLKYSWSFEPNIGTIEGDSGLVYWSFNQGEITKNTVMKIKVTVFDGKNLVSKTINLTLLAGSDASSNQPPATTPTSTPIITPPPTSTSTPTTTEEVIGEESSEVVTEDPPVEEVVTEDPPPNEEVAQGETPGNTVGSSSL